MTARSLERARARSHTAGAHAIPTRTLASRELFGVLADAQRVTGEPRYEGSKTTRHSYSRHFSHLDHLLSAEQHVGDDLGQAAQIMYPSQWPDDACCGDFST